MPMAISILTPCCCIPPMGPSPCRRISRRRHGIRKIPNQNIWITMSSRRHHHHYHQHPAATFWWWWTEPGPRPNPWYRILTLPSKSFQPSCLTIGRTACLTPSGKNRRNTARRPSRRCPERFSCWVLEATTTAAAIQVAAKTEPPAYAIVRGPRMLWKRAFRQWWTGSCGLPWIERLASPGMCERTKQKRRRDLLRPLFPSDSKAGRARWFPENSRLT